MDIHVFIYAYNMISNCSWQCHIIMISSLPMNHFNMQIFIFKLSKLTMTMNDNENMFITIDLHIYKIQDARYQYTENKHQTLFFLW